MHLAYKTMKQKEAKENPTHAVESAGNLMPQIMLPWKSVQGQAPKFSKIHTQKYQKMLITPKIQTPTFYFSAFSLPPAQGPGFYPFQIASSKTHPATCPLTYSKNTQPLTPDSLSDCGWALHACTDQPGGSSAAKPEQNHRQDTDTSAAGN